MTIDFRTNFEKARDERHSKICEDFQLLTEEMPGHKPHRIMTIVAERYSMTATGIKSILMRRGVYKTNSKP